MQTTEPKQITPWKKWERWQRRTVRVIVGTFIFLFLIAVFGPEPDVPPKTAEQITADSIKHVQDSAKYRQDLLIKNNVFRQWDGSSPALVEMVKESMNDPNSFEHLETRYFDKGRDSLTVIMDYTGKNAFGGRVRGKIMAMVSAKDGSIIKIMATE